MRARRVLIAVSAISACTAQRLDRHGVLNPPKTPKPPELTQGIAIREYAAPGHPHDTAVGPRGDLWYTAQRANALGRIDPQTGESDRYPLDVSDSGPHGLVADANGDIWFTANSKGYIGKLDPESGAVTEYPLRDPRAADPHTPIFGRDGKLYFTVQQGNLVGRLDPSTGQVELVEVPTPHAEPYGIVAGDDGAIYFCEFGTNQLGRLDPERMTITELALPDPAARPRRLALAPAGAIYYTDFARGYLGRFDPSTGKIDEWPSPGGAYSQPYAIAVTSNGDVWFVETGVHPNMLVRFDPRARSFARWTIPSGGGVVRNMVATPDDRLYLAESGVDKVAIAEVQP